MSALQKLNFRKNRLDLNVLSYWLPEIVRRRLRDLGWVTEADIDMIVDASGFSYSDQWPSKLRIRHLHNELQRFAKYGKPYVFLPQAFGPFSDADSRANIARSFPMAAMICARETQSRSYIEEVTGALPNLFQYGDFTNLMDGIIPETTALVTRAACIVPNYNMIDARNSNTAWLNTYENLLLTAIDYYRELGLTPFFLNQGGVPDNVMITRLNRQLEKRAQRPLEIVHDNNPLITKGVIGASSAVFCSRYHGCIAALSNGIACVGTSWSHKYDALYSQYDASELLLSPEMSVKECTRIIDVSLDRNAPVQKRIAEQAVIQKDSTNAMWAKFFAIVSSYMPSSNSDSRLHPKYSQR
jgi:colanic acid/amylovoran biosynthesis protein